MQNDVLNSMEKLVLLSVLEKLVYVGDGNEFLDWVDYDLKPIFPHQTFICGTVDIRENPVVVQRLLFRDFPMKFFDHFRRQGGGLISTPCMRQWAKEGEPNLFDPESQAEVDPDTSEQFRRYNLRNVASHGAKSIDGDDASYFSFASISLNSSRETSLLATS